MSNVIIAFVVIKGTNGALWSLIAAGCYSRAVMLGEEMKEARENRSRGGGV